MSLTLMDQGKKLVRTKLLSIGIQMLGVKKNQVHYPQELNSHLVTN
jgi:hypothetical protein